LAESSGLSGAEIAHVVNAYIGVSGGYLNGFTYRGLDEFYPLYCGLDIDPSSFPGSTTRERFISVMRTSEPHAQARILRGLLEKVPQPTASGPHVMSCQEVEALIGRLEGLPVPHPQLANPRAIVERALQDARTLLERRDAVSAVDRLHTALHGYLRGACDDAGITYEADARATRLLRLLRENHPALQREVARSEEVGRVLMSMGSVVDAMGTIRNTASVAHPNESLIGDAEAMLVVNACRTILHYLDSKLGSSS
jgi:hypothetical protein